MALSFSYQPPTVDAAVVVHAALTAAETAAAQHILAKSQELVPVDTGALKASGHVEHDGTSAAIVYDAVAPDDYAYGIRQHEDLSLNHPHGGQAKYLEQPMHTELEAVAAIVAAEIRKALG